MADTTPSKSLAASVAGGSYDYLLKLLMVGDAGTGKTSILLRFTEDRFQDEQLPTIGVDLRVKFLDVESGGDKKRVKLTVWDTAGQERFRTLTASYYRGSHGCVLVYDVTRRETFESLAHWCAEIDHHTGGGANIVKVLVGNKIDAADARQVSRREGEMFARDHNMIFIEASAKTRAGIQQVFTELSMQILQNPALLAAPGTAPAAASAAGAGQGGVAVHPGEADEGSGCC